MRTSRIMLRHILGNLFLPFSRTHHFPNFPPAPSDWFTKVHGGHIFAPRKASRSLTEGRLSRPTRATVGCLCLCFQSMSSYILQDIMIYRISGLNSKPTEIQTAKKPHHFFYAALVRENQLDRDQLSTCAPLLQQLGAIHLCQNPKHPIYRDLL